MIHHAFPLDSAVPFSWVIQGSSKQSSGLVFKRKNKPKKSEKDILYDYS